MKKKPTEKFQAPNQISLYGQNRYTEYTDSFNKFMVDVVADSSDDPEYDFHSVGSNLVFYMRGRAEPHHFERNYEIECSEVKKSYQKLMHRIEEIKDTTSRDTIELPINSFVRSIDIFLQDLLNSTYGNEILEDKPRYESISNASILHDCLTQTLSILNDEDVFVLGDLS